MFDKVIMSALKAKILSKDISIYDIVLNDKTYNLDKLGNYEHIIYD